MGRQMIRPSQFGTHLEAFLEERGVGPSQLAGGSGITLAHVVDLITGDCILTADVALVLSEFFETSPLLWLELQRQCCLEAREEGELDVRMTA